MLGNGQNNPSSIRRQVWGGLFGQCIGKSRRAAGLSVEEAARLVGMEAAELQAVEAGHVPDPAWLFPMADALGFGRNSIATLALLCQDAWNA